MGSEEEGGAGESIGGAGAVLRFGRAEPSGAAGTRKAFGVLSGATRGSPVKGLRLGRFHSGIFIFAGDGEDPGGGGGQERRRRRQTRKTEPSRGVRKT